MAKSRTRSRRKRTRILKLDWASAAPSHRLAELGAGREVFEEKEIFLREENWLQRADSRESHFGAPVNPMLSGKNLPCHIFGIVPGVLCIVG